MFKFIFFVFAGYLIFKAIKFFKIIFAVKKSAESSQRVYDAPVRKSKIDKKDVIDAQFEEIEIKDKSNPTE